MELRDFIGEVVIDTSTNKRYLIDKIDGVSIYVKDEMPNAMGLYCSMRYQTGTAPSDNAIAKGKLRFEEELLTEPFKAIYELYRSNEGKHDQYLYYCSKFD